MSLRRSLPALILAAWALAGCGTPSGQEEASAAVEAFVRLCAAGEGAAAQELLTSSRREAFVSADSAAQGCARALGAERAPGGSEAFREARVADVHVEGVLGEATVILPTGLSSRMELEQVEGRWRIGLPLVPPA